MSYVDGYVLPIKKKNLKAYRQMAKAASSIWKRHGSLEYFECALEDSKCPAGISFPKAIKTKAGETVIFSFVVFKSRAHRDKVNAAVMKDPKLAAMMKEGQVMPFDCTRMIYSGFKALVEA